VGNSNSASPTGPKPSRSALPPFECSTYSFPPIRNDEKIESAWSQLFFSKDWQVHRLRSATNIACPVRAPLPLAVVDHQVPRKQVEFRISLLSRVRDWYSNVFSTCFLFYKKIQRCCKLISIFREYSGPQGNNHTSNHSKLGKQAFRRTKLPFEITSTHPRNCSIITRKARICHFLVCARLLLWWVVIQSINITPTLIADGRKSRQSYWRWD
jgi:hypothetical protein